MPIATRVILWQPFVPRGRWQVFGNGGVALSERLLSPAANQAQLIETGVTAGNIELAGVCTMCRNDLFYSFRREGQGCGHFGLLAALAAV